MTLGLSPRVSFQVHRQAIPTIPADFTTFIGLISAFLVRKYRIKIIVLHAVASCDCNLTCTAAQCSGFLRAIAAYEVILQQLNNLWCGWGRDLLVFSQSLIVRSVLCMSSLTLAEYTTSPTACTGTCALRCRFFTLFTRTG